MIMCVSNHTDWTEHSISCLAFGLGTLLSIALVIIIQMLKGRNALSIWLMFLTLTLLGLAALLYDSPISIISGSFAYGLGDSLGYIILYYLCAGAIKRSKSLRMFRLYCMVSFTEYFIISSLFSFYFQYFDVPDKILAFGIVLAKYLTISAGLANIVPNDNNSSAQALDLADKALYTAKKSGRNRVGVFILPVL